MGRWSTALASLAVAVAVLDACSSSNGNGAPTPDAGTESGPSSSSGGPPSPSQDGEATASDGSPAGTPSAEASDDGPADSSAADGPDASSPDGQSPPADVGVIFPTDPTCSRIGPTAPPILTNLVTGSPGGFTGGSIVAGGTYYVTANTAYTADSSCTYVDPCANSAGNSTTLSVLPLAANAGTIDIKTITCLGKESCVAYCYTTSGSSMTLLPIADIASDPSCLPGVGDAGTLTYPYTATSTTLSLHLPDGAAAGTDACAITVVQTAALQ
jgi:hypothetical protein